MRNKLAVIATAMCLAILADSSAKAEDILAKKAETGEHLPAWQMFNLYSNKTWLWKDGAGYFSPVKRQFSGWSGSGKSASYGQGIWFLTDDGKFCFRAKWTTNRGTTSNVSCFEHVAVDGTIYARNTDKGEWYVVRGKGEKYQEASKLRRGDRVRRQVDAIMKSADEQSAGNG